MHERLRSSVSVIEEAMRNSPLCWLLLAYGLFEIAEYSTWIALLLYGYRHGGATGSLVMSLVQLVPSAFLAPVLGGLADRRAPERVLRWGYVSSALSVAALGAAIAAGLPVAVVFAVAPLGSLSLTVARPAQAALMPSIVRSAEELTASNVMAGWADAGSTVAGPTLAGLCVAASGTGLAVQVGAGMILLSVVAAAVGLRAAPLLSASREAAARERPRTGPRRSPARASLAEAARAAGRSLELVRHSRETLLLLGLDGFSLFVLGALEIVIVVLASQSLHLGLSGAGYLTASFGAGSVLAGALTMTLVGRPRLARVLAAAMAGAGAAVGALGLAPTVTGAFVLLGLAGLGASVVDVTAKTLLQRAAPSDSIAGAFSLLEALTCVGLALGASFARATIDLGGPRASLLALCGLSLVVVASTWRGARGIDVAANVPQAEVRLLRSIPIFGALPAPELERVARELLAVRVDAGTAVVREGEAGDRYYAVADGRLAVSQGGSEINALVRGDGFGEIALVRAVPRTATVTAVTDSTLYGLDQATFLSVLTRSPPARKAAEGIVEGRLGPR